VHPASRAGATLLLISAIGAFHGMIAPTTPAGSRTIRPNCPAAGLVGSSNGNVPARSANALKVACAPAPPKRAIACNTPDSRGQIWPMSSPRLPSSPPMARRYPARSAWASCGQGPASNACRAASTALETSDPWASATLKNSSSVPESITLITASDEGLTHCPPMKKRSACRIGALTSSARLIWCPPIGSLAPCREKAHGLDGSLTATTKLDLTACRNPPRLDPPCPRSAMLFTF